MTTAHTPGPWLAVGYQVEVPSDSIPDICNTNPETFGQHGRSEKERRANARLIAAAPELLEALHAIKIMMDECREHARTITVAEAYDSFYQEIVEGVIAKATRATQ